MAPVKGCCDFCGRPSNDVLYGPLHRRKDIKCHYYCLLFSSSLGQKGRDDEGILGFLLPDVRKELQKASKVICSYCNKPGAVSKCYANKCRKRFHLPCGMERGSLHLFFDDFRSYCGTHRRKQRVPADILNSRDVTCSICFEPVEDLNSNDSIWAPCCKKNGWFHRICLQKFALSAAYFFKCPLCASQRKFRDAMLRNGIYIPDQDASWELEPNAFAELLERHHQCDAAVCKCPKGRKYESESSRVWNLVLCRNCASKGTHIGCIPGPRSSMERRSTWDCNDCQVVTRGQQHSQRGEIIPAGYQNSEYDEDEDEDEIIVVDDDPENQLPEASSDKSRVVANFTLNSPNVRKILSNVIHLKSASADLIDLVNDENEMMEIVVSDDEDPFTTDDKAGIQVDDPSICGAKEESSSSSTKIEDQSSPRLLESSLAFRHEVGNHSLLPVTKSPRSACREISPRKNRRECFRRGVKNFNDRNFKGNSKIAFSYCGSKEISSSKCPSYSSHYIGLRSITMGKKHKGCISKKHCLKCKKMIKAHAGLVYDDLLVDGWSEILNGPIFSSYNTNNDYNRDICKHFWLRTAKWICGATSCLSALRCGSLERNRECCKEPLKINHYQNVDFCGIRKTGKKLMINSDNCEISLRELLIGLLY